jgi:hypothetical protein
VANVTATKPRNPASGQIVVTGTAAAPDGSRIPLEQLEQRLVNPDLFARNGRRTLRAPGDGTVQYVGTTGNTWRATYTGLSGTDVTKALASESRILWLGADPAKENQLTIFELGEGVQNGPEPPCTAPPRPGSARPQLTRNDGRGDIAPAVGVLAIRSPSRSCGYVQALAA